MKDVRQGNDTSVIWGIFNEGVPVNLLNYELSLYLTHKFGKETITDFKANGNNISWTFYGKSQKVLGAYTLTLVLNEGKEDMHTVDACDFINIVPCSCEISGGADNEGMQTEVVNLTSTLEFSKGAVEVDSELSETSENPVQNKVITGALSEMQEALGEKQEQLVSGENIKTINGESLLGEGDIKIEGKNYDSELAARNVGAVDVEGDTEAPDAPSGGGYDDTEIREELAQLSAKVNELGKGEAYIIGDTLTFRNYADASIEGETLKL